MKRWITVPYNSEAADHLEKSGGLPPAVSRLFSARGFQTIHQINSFCESRLSGLTDPFLLNGVEQASLRLIQALKNHERVTVFGDYDVDGITSTVLLTRCLNELGIQTTPFIPSRIEEGYGVSTEAMKRCVEDTAPNLIVTVDCGVSAVKQVKEANDLGIDVIITDHHEPGDEVPDAVAVINPKLQSASPFSDIAGVGVAFKLLHGLVKYGRLAKLPLFDSFDLRHRLDFVAVGSICDVVPLTDENRVFAKQGLNYLKKTQIPGFVALAECAGLSLETIGSYQVGFHLGPRLNAAGRIAEAETSLKLLLTDDFDEARKNAELLNAFNLERRKMEERILNEACEQIEMSKTAKERIFLIVQSKNWHPGVIGIVASRLVQKYYRPTAVISFDENGLGRGSARSIESFNLVESIEAFSYCLEKFGGHPMAAGFSIKEAKLEEFSELINTYASQKLGQHDLHPVVHVDCTLFMREFDEVLYQWVEQLEPFGTKNSKPVFAFCDEQVFVTEKKLVGQKHTRVTITDGSHFVRGIYFNHQPHEIPEQHQHVKIAFSAQLNTFRDTAQLEMQIVDIQPA